jgi:hypothetical protein
MPGEPEEVFMKSIREWIVPLSLLLLAASTLGPRARAQETPEPCTSFAQLAPDAGAPFGYTIPLLYGSFADVEVAAASSGTVQLQVEVVEKSAIRDRRIWILVPGRVVLLSDVLGVDDLFDIGEELVVRVEASAPVSAVLVRRD